MGSSLTSWNAADVTFQRSVVALQLLVGRTGRRSSHVADRFFSSEAATLSVLRVRVARACSERSTLASWGSVGRRGNCNRARTDTRRTAHRETGSARTRTPLAVIHEGPEVAIAPRGVEISASAGRRCARSEPTTAIATNRQQRGGAGCARTRPPGSRSSGRRAASTAKAGGARMPGARDPMVVVARQENRNRRRPTRAIGDLPAAPCAADTASPRPPMPADRSRAERSSAHGG